MSHVGKGALALLALLMGCDSLIGGDGPGPAARFELIGDLQRTLIGTELPQPIGVRVLDARGRPVRGHVVSFHVVSGGGSVFAGAAQTDREGIARDRWTLGTSTSEIQSVEARSAIGGSAPAVVGTFRALPVAGPVARIEAGPAPAAVAGQPTAASIFLFDAYGNGAAGATVTWTVVSGGGSVSPASSVTDSLGRAVTQWTPGQVVGYQSIRATHGSFAVDISSDVRPEAAVRLRVQPDTVLVGVGQRTEVTAFGESATGQRDNNIQVTWEVINPAIATVNAGRTYPGGPFQLTSLAVGTTILIGRTSTGLADTVPLRVVDLSAWPALTAVSIDAAGYACAITAAAEGYCWGSNEAVVAKPVAGRFRRLVAGYVGQPLAACGILLDGHLQCWNGSPWSTPERIGDRTFSEVDVFADFACAISDGAVYCWGNNAQGQLGTGDGAPRSGLVRVAIPGDPQIKQVSVSQYHACAITTTGVAFCWGQNTGGELGTTVNDCFSCGPVAPTPVMTLVRFDEIDAGRRMSCGRSSGEAYCWGYQPLYGGTGGREPKRIDYTGFTQLSVTTTLACGPGADTRVVCWGDGSVTFSINQHPVAYGGLALQVELSDSRICLLRPDYQIDCLGIGYLGGGGLVYRDVQRVVRE